MPYEDKGATFRDEDILTHIDSSYNKPDDRSNYKYVSIGVDWGRCLPLFIGI